ncbi:hypothetical protein DSO57_1026217 [Entomophthora muscae]|uniref:Uncharacterized protein n=1 Tax=Entomophthora muscae TaxID=34485 RepID=A0ACC2U0I4_9FUNG|nr:hypothetical protein DSO57_1026217 [Entomophthora muscae]
MSTGRFISSPIKAYAAPGAQEPVRSNLEDTNAEAQVDKAASSQATPFFDPATGKFVNSVVNEPSQQKASVGYFDIKTGKFAVGPQSEPTTSDIKDNTAGAEKAIYPSNYLESTKTETTPTAEATYTANISEATKAEEAPAPGVGYFDVATGRFVNGSQTTAGEQDGSNQLEVSSTTDTLANADAEVPSVDIQTPKKKKGSSGKKHSSKSKSKGKSKNKATQSDVAYEQDAAAINLNSNSLVDQMHTLRSLENQYSTESDSESCDEDSQDDPDSASSASTPMETEFTKAEPTKNPSLELPLFSKTSLAILIGIYMVASYNSSSKSSGSMLMIIPLLFLLVICVAVMNASAWIKYSKFGWRCNADMSITLFEDAEDLDSRCVTLTTTNILSILFLGIALISILAMTSVTSFYAVGSMTKEACCSGL